MNFCAPCKHNARATQLNARLSARKQQQNYQIRQHFGVFLPAFCGQHLIAKIGVRAVQKLFLLYAKLKRPYRNGFRVAQI